jgi:multiple sugar transport system permease protein
VLKYGFVAPALLLLVALNIFPLFYTIYLSATNTDLSGGEPRFVGARNYREVFTEPRYGAAIRTTAVFVGAAVAIELVLGFLLALALRDEFPGKAAILTILLIPMMLSPAVMGLFWHLIFKGDYGILNQTLGAMGLPRPDWLTNPSIKLVSVLIVDVWMWTPFMMLISLAALNSIPKHLYEAAEIDRAGRWTVLWRITLPLSAPLLVLAALLRATDALKQFDFVMVLTGPNDAATQTLSALIYQTAFNGYNVGLGAAYGFVVLVAVIALATAFTRYLDLLQRRQGRAA